MANWVRIYFILLTAIVFLAGCSGGMKIKSYAPVPERGEVISGRIIKPEGDGPFPGIIILHGCAGITDLHYQWAHRFKKWGYASLVLDSHGPRHISLNCGKRKVSILERALDAHAAKVQFGNLPFVDRARIGVVGMSEGGGTILEAVNHNLVAYTLPEQARDPFKAAVAFYPYCSFKTTSNANLMILIGDKDDWCPASLCEMNTPTPYDSTSEVILKVYPGATHSFDFPKPNRTFLGHNLRYSPSAMKDVVPRVKGFLDKYLK